MSCRRPLAVAQTACGLAVLLCLLAGAGAAAPQPLAIRAYINVSSGCQASTVDLLNSLRARHKPYLTLELIDFGDRGKGLKRWQQSGYRCLTIELNGSPLVKYPAAGKQRAVSFQMPAGFYWTHTDLQQAVAAGLEGKLQRATPAEVAAAAPARRLAAKAVAGSGTQGGRRVGTVKVNGTIVMYIPGPASEADKRARTAAAALNKWLAAPVKLSQLSLTPVTGGCKLLAAGKGVITATAADGRTYRLQPRAVAEAWLSALTHALAAGPR